MNQVAIVSCHRSDVNACVVYSTRAVAAFQQIVHPRLLRLMSDAVS
jgi:hypothetical protein